MKNHARAVLVGTCALYSAVVFADMPKISWELDDAIRQVDRQADNFETAMARVDFVVTDADGASITSHSGDGFINERGDMRYSQEGGNRILMVDRNTVSDYDKSANTVTEYSLSRHKERLEPFYRLGFSISGKDMQDRFLVTILGEEELGDTRTLVLELTPKRDAERATVGKIRLWIDQGSWMPRRQEFGSTADRSTTTLDYTNMARNLKLNPDLFKDSWPRGTKKVRG
jgi:outer membrane lipoprotein-sorting protein